MFDDEKHLARIVLSECVESHAVSRRISEGQSSDGAEVVVESGAAGGLELEVVRSPSPLTERTTPVQSR